MSVRVQINLKGADSIDRIKTNMDRARSAVARATTAAAREAALRIEEKGRRDIAAGGNFGSRWLTGFHARVSTKSGALTNAVIIVSHDVPYASVFETGKVINGRPLLWIPLPFTGIKGIRARDYPASSHFFVFDRKDGGRPLLFFDGQPKYFGIESVTLKKRFHIADVVRGVMKNYKKLYKENLKV